MLNNSFYTIINKQISDQDVIYTIDLNANHDIFKGHFPDNPVTPGVIQMEIVKELVSDFKGSSAHLVSMSNCKFLAILNPFESAKIDVQLTIITNEDTSLKVNVVFKNETTSFLKMNAVYSLN
jgi:3-hydroxyacyl-[acyl-carrier-protein] dehydratase